MGKYTLLEMFLKATPPHVQEITLSFAQIEMIIGANLPPSHWKYRPWWANQRDISIRPHARAWLNTGFVVKAVHQDKDNGWVTFARSQ